MARSYGVAAVAGMARSYGAAAARAGLAGALWFAIAYIARWCTQDFLYERAMPAIVILPPRST